MLRHVVVSCMGAAAKAHPSKQDALQHAEVDYLGTADDI